MIELTFRPIDQRPPHWKAADEPRTFSPFSASWTSTRELLDRELDQLDCRDAFLQVELADPAGGVRLDGQLRAGAKVVHPGVILTIDTRSHGVLTYDCDRFDTWRSRGQEPWQANLRAIALGLEALRKIDRYGLGAGGAQYAGFRAIGTGGAIELDEAITLEEASRLLADAAGLALGAAGVLPADQARVAYRDAVKTHHPDRGGDPDTFRRLTAARDLLTGGDA